MVADELDYVIGVDTHLDEHTLAIIAAPSGALVARHSIQASARGYAAALRFAADQANGARVWAIEGTGSYGAGLARFLLAAARQCSRNPDYWARLIRRPDQSLRNARLALRRSLDLLESVDLIRNTTPAGVPLIHLLDESGSGTPYSHPSRTGERYFTLPHEYWFFGFDRRFDLAAKAVLVLARSLRPSDFTLPLANALPWYGISAQTLRRGMRQLIDAGVVRYTSTVVPAPKAPNGTTTRRSYTLIGPLKRTTGGARPAKAGPAEGELPF